MSRYTLILDIVLIRIWWKRGRSLFELLCVNCSVKLAVIYHPFKNHPTFEYTPPQCRCHLPDLQQLPKEEKSQSPPRSKASDSGSAPTAAASAAVSAAAKSRQPNIKQSNAPRGWQESSESVVHNRHGAAQDQGVNSKSQNGPETAGLRGRGRAVRGQGSRGGSKARQQSTRPGRLETSSRSVEGGQQEQQQKRVENSRPDETSSSVPQKCAEEKAQSANLSNLRKSPRSKEVRFCPLAVSPSIRCSGMS